MNMLSFRKIVVLCFLPGLFVLQSCNSPEANSEKPNIIFIMADDLGYGDVGCYGQEVIQTPHIDRLAARGMRFTQHYAGNTVCAPSRCALMTGYHMGHAEIRGNKQAEPSGQWPISDQALTVAEILKKAGYKTGMVGKWGLGIDVNSGNPLRQGFDFYYGYLDQVLAHNYYPEFLIRNGKREYLDNEVTYLDTTLWHKGLGSYSTKRLSYSHDLMALEVLDFIRASKEGPFFLYVPFTIPHDNGEEPIGERQEVPDHGIYADQDWPGEEKGYAAMITRMDKDVGRILDLLTELHLASNTIVFFTSDNGPVPDRSYTAFFNSNGPYRGGKMNLYEGGIRVPMIVAWEGQIEPGTQSDHISAFWDFLPTACDLAEVEPPSGIDGISMLPVLTGHPQETHESLYWEFTEAGGAQAIRKGNWKLVRNQVISEAPGTTELYNLEEDPQEQNNIAEDFPDVAEDLIIEMGKSRFENAFFPLLELN